MKKQTAASKALDAAIQRALVGRSIDVMKIGPMHRAIEAAIAGGTDQAIAIAAALVVYTEPAK